MWITVLRLPIFLKTWKLAWDIWLQMLEFRFEPMCPKEVDKTSRSGVRSTSKSKQSVVLPCQDKKVS
jgi:hypothetical protein